MYISLPLASPAEHSPKTGTNTANSREVRGLIISRGHRRWKDATNVADRSQSVNRVGYIVSVNRPWEDRSLWDVLTGAMVFAIRPVSKTHISHPINFRPSVHTGPRLTVSLKNFVLAPFFIRISEDIIYTLSGCVQHWSSTAYLGKRVDRSTMPAGALRRGGCQNATTRVVTLHSAEIK